MSAVPQRPELAATEPLLLEARISESRLELSLIIPRDLVYFRGHFPNLAVLPGVVQIDWVMTYGKRYFNLGDASAETLQIKFRGLIVPGDRVLLTLVYESTRDQIDFTYGNAEGTKSSGRIGLKRA